MINRFVTFGCCGVIKRNVLPYSVTSHAVSDGTANIKI